VVGAVALRNEALNWTPWVRSLTTSARLDELAGRNHRRMVKHEVALPARFGPQHAEAVLRVVEGDTFDETGQDLTPDVRRRRMLHPRELRGPARKPLNMSLRPPDIMFAARGSSNTSPADHIFTLSPRDLVALDERCEGIGHRLLSGFVPFEAHTFKDFGAAKTVRIFPDGA
jgi:hypothetical protein